MMVDQANGKKYVKIEYTTKDIWSREKNLKYDVSSIKKRSFFMLKFKQIARIKTGKNDATTYSQCGFHIST